MIPFVIASESAYGMPRIFRAQPRQSGERVQRQGSGKYTYAWTRFSLDYRRRHPFCAECYRLGRLTYVGVVVDHKFPVADGGEMFPGDEGVWTLCDSHHSGWKAMLEAYARETGQMDKIVMWCDEPETRPKLRGEVRDGRLDRHHPRR